MLKVKTYNGQKDAHFFIQSHGLHAGRPLKKPIPNCFAVWTNKENAFEIVFSLYKAKAFDYYITGTVIPFVRKFEIIRLLQKYFAKEYDSKKLIAIQDISKLIEIQDMQKMKYQQFQIALAQKLLQESA